MLGGFFVDVPAFSFCVVFFSLFHALDHVVPNRFEKASTDRTGAVARPTYVGIKREHHPGEHETKIKTVLNYCKYNIIFKTQAGYVLEATLMKITRCNP